jgi:hypothetical protein
MEVQHKAERGANAEGWDLTLVIDCTKEQHERLQELIGHQLAEDRLVNRSDLGKGVESGACWDLGVYMSEISKHKLVDDGTGKGTMVRACVKAGKKSASTLVDDGSGMGTKVRACVKVGKKGGKKGGKNPQCHDASGRWLRQRDHGEAVQQARELHHLQRGAATKRE